MKPSNDLLTNAMSISRSAQSLLSADGNDA